MTQEIKQRIEQIKRGEVPQGYKSTKVGIVPDEWDTPKANILFKNISDKSHNGELEVLSATQDKGVIPRSEVNIYIKYDEGSLNNYKKVCKGDFVISLRSFQGGIEYSEYEGIVSPAYTVIKEKQEIFKLFYKSYLKSPNYIQRLNVAVYGIRDGKQISYEDFGFIELPEPTLSEQQKIAEILTIQDKAIDLKEKLLAQKQKQKKWLMQNLLTGKKRLSGFSGEWIKVKAQELFKSITDKSHNGELDVLSATQDRGIIPRCDIDIDIKYDINPLSSYKKVSKGNFVISLRSFQGGIEYSEHDGIISPAYTVLTRIKLIEDGYYMQFFKSVDYISRLNVAVYGIRDGKQISCSDFGIMTVPYPPLPEQTAIAKILSTADHEIDLMKKDIAAEKQKKKALMQLLLTGIVRVDV